MKVWTLEDAQALVGTTWEKDGLRRHFTRIGDLRVAEGIPFGDVYWCRPGREERAKPVWFPHIAHWLEGATQVEGATT